MRLTSLAILVGVLVGANAWGQQKKEPAKPPAAVEGVTVTVKGEADIRGERVAEAKEQARQNAMRAAVEQVFGAKVSGFSATEDFAIVSDYVTSQSSGYVRSSEVLEENVNEEDALVSVTMKVEVAKGEIDSDVAGITALLAQRTTRRIYVLISDVSEAALGGPDAKTASLFRHGIFDVKLRERLRKEGFNTLDPNMVDGKLNLPNDVRAITTADARSIGNVLNADAVIYGTALIRSIANAPDPNAPKGFTDGAPIFSALAQTSISVLSPDAEAEIGGWEGSETASAYFQEKAIEVAVAKAADKAVVGARNALFNAWLSQRQGGSSIRVTVKGLLKHGDFVAMKAMLKDSSHQIKEVSRGKFDRGLGAFDLVVGPGVTPESLAGDLEGKKFRGQTVGILKVNPSALELELTR